VTDLWKYLHTGDQVTGNSKDRQQLQTGLPGSERGRLVYWEVVVKSLICASFPLEKSN
jgi:hypothetical protein